MTLSYAATRSSVWRWYWRSLRRNERHRIAWLTWMLGAFLVGFGLFRGSSSSSSATVAGLGASVFLAACFALYPQLRFKPQVRTLTFLPEELRTTIKGQSKTYSWSDVASIEEDGGFVIIALKNLNAFIVPPHAFSDSVERRALVAKCLEWWRAG
ncbi:MAG TPA: YcxB family protein [Polyangia bacterium]|nr:YcxB family protein [Polyangia bacterium]